MIVAARYYPKGKVTHRMDLRWSRQRHFRTLCGSYRHYDDLAAPFPRGRDCKTCMRIASYHQRRPRPVSINLAAFWQWRKRLEENNDRRKSYDK